MVEPLAKKPDPVLAALGGRIRAARQRAGLSQEELASRAGMDRTYVSGIERGRRNVAVLNLCALAQALSVDVSDLVGGLQSAAVRDRAGD